MKRKEPLYKTEADCCAAFIAWASGQGLVAYPETQGWDILLVAGDGTQIGVQAKLKFNIKVLQQSLDDGWSFVWRDEGPDFRAVLVADDSGCRSLCAALGLILFEPYRIGGEGRFQPEFRDHHYNVPQFWNPVRRLKLPAYVPDVPAGTPAPRQLSEWKIAALRILACLEVRGFVTREDFKRYQIDPRLWVTNKWVVHSAPGEWVRGTEVKFASEHPTIWPKVLEDVRDELAKRPPVARQAPLPVQQVLA